MTHSTPLVRGEWNSHSVGRGAGWALPELGQQAAPRGECVDAVDSLLEDRGNESFHDAAGAADAQMREASMSFGELGMFGGKIFGFVVETEQRFGAVQEFRGAGTPGLYPDRMAIRLGDAVGHRTESWRETRQIAPSADRRCAGSPGPR